MMRRYFYTSGPLMSKFIQKNTMLKRLQDQHFRNAMLSAKYLSPQQPYQQLYEKIIQMTMGQQIKYTSNYHLECLFNHFNVFNRVTQGKNTFIDKCKSHIKDIVDPDKFPIFDLKENKANYHPVWEYLAGKLRHQIGFQLVVRDSKLEHHQAGKGVKIILANHKKQIQPGQFLGFVPGSIYQSLNSYKKYRLKKLTKYERIPYHCHFSSGKILQLCEIPLQRVKYDYNKDRVYQGHQKLSQVLVDGSFINPFALGHMINHPGPFQQQNVCFSQISIPKGFFPSYWLRYFPNMNNLDHMTNMINLFGIFALKPILSNSELFVNYLQNHIYPIDNIPQWYIKPNRQSDHFDLFQKKEYQLPNSSYWTYMEKKSLQRNKQLYQKYEHQTQYTPGKIQYDDGQKVIRKMNITNPQKHNQYL